MASGWSGLVLQLLAHLINDLKVDTDWSSIVLINDTADSRSKREIGNIPGKHKETMVSPLLPFDMNKAKTFLEDLFDGAHKLLTMDENLRRATAFSFCDRRQ